MSSKKKLAYDVGYGKPPTETRFQKGKSGNPSGRPKKVASDIDPGKILQSIDNERITVKVDGKNRRMLKAEINIQQLFSRAFKGDQTAARLIAKMAAKYFGPEANGPSDLRFVVMPHEYFVRPRQISQEEIVGSGYRSSPKNGQLRNARSGNSIERSTENQRPVSVGYLFRRVARERVPIKIDGGRTEISRWQLYVRQIYGMALNKNNSAARLLDQLRMQFPGEAFPGDPIYFAITEEDAKL